MAAAMTGASIAAVDAAAAMPAAPLAQAAAPLPLQGASYPGRHPEGDPNQALKKHDEKGYPANPGGAEPRGAARERYQPHLPSGKPRRHPELQ